MSHMSAAGQAASTGTFTPGPGAAIVSDDLSTVLEAGHDEVGWLAQKGRVPLGYLGDAEKTARTFPVIDGVRFSVPGDRARLTSDGVIELYGRDSVTINSGGEKIFAEEVEQAIAHHPAVYDVVVCGRPSERWGQEVVALVQLRSDSEVSRASLLEECARHVARYKLPKAVIFLDHIVRSPSGKADYRWAQAEALSAGFHSVHALPMRLRGTVIGALNLFRTDHGEMSPADIDVAQAFADVATIGILQHRAAQDAQVINDQLAHALNSRIVIEQAKGMVAERLDLDMEQAFAVLRGHARNHNLRLVDVAEAVIAGTLGTSALDRPSGARP
jgi:GAF domain-containing protein